jgi:hypothetical protein
MSSKRESSPKKEKKTLFFISKAMQQQFERINVLFSKTKDQINK